MAIYSNFDEFPGLSFDDPTIKKIGEIILPEDYLNDGTVTLWVHFNEIPNVIGDFVIKLEKMPVVDYNGEAGNMEDRIWDYLNDPANGHLVTT